MVATWVADRTVQATLNTGCSQTLVTYGLVRENMVDWCKPVRMRCIHGEVGQYERGYVDLRIAKQRGRMRIGFVPKLDSQMIMGRD